MNDKKKKLLVVYEDGQADLERTAKAIKAGVSKHASVKLRLASEVAIPEILAADAYAFGVDGANTGPWAELTRAMSGMNLAGRRAAFFTLGGASPNLRAAMSDAELSIMALDLVPGADPVAWAELLLE